MDDELLAFPPETPANSNVSPLTDDELLIIRKMIADYNKKHTDLSNENAEIKPNANVSSLFQSEELPSKTEPINNLFNDAPIVPPQPSVLLFSDDSSNNKSSEINFSELLNNFKNCDANELEVIDELKGLITSLDSSLAKQLTIAIFGLIPCKRYLRHGTPEQKLFALKCLSDRFLENIAGLKFAERRRLLKLISRYLSDVSENYSFIAMEGEPFKPTFHERVSGSSSSGLVIKEMRSFLIVDSRTNRVIYTGLVLS